ncbi:MAG TPA: ABC transporter permease [Candidatus Limnocylindrales bacterium]|nr:ABC transporter permease [Candidatus Limnocylindrales bacterium]
MWERIRVMLRKEFIQALRDPRMRVLLFIPPVVQLVVFGFAVNLDVDHARIGWMDMDRTPLSRELRERFEGSGRFDVVAMPHSEEDVHQALDRSTVEAVIRVLPNFERDVNRGRQTEIQVLVDGTNSNTASLVSSYAGQIVAGFAGDVMAGQQNVRVLTRSANSAVNLTFPNVTARSRVWFNPDLYSRNYFVPGVVANIIMMITLMLTALAIVREKEIGTMEQLMVTPIRPMELMLGKTLPFAVVGLIDVVLITGVALLLFHVPFRGSPLLLLACSILFLMTTLGAGLFLSTISQTQQQAMMANFFFSTPAFMLSGFAFPIRNMPVAVQWLTYLNPLRYFMEVVRGIFLKGVGVSVLWPQMVAMAVYGVVVLFLSAARFHKTLD